MKRDLVTRRVRAYNVRLRDELPFFDVRTLRERTMVVVAVEERESNFPVHLTVVMRGSSRKQRYLINFKRNQLVRVRRKEPR